MKTLAAVLVCGLLISCNSAFAGDIDLSTWTCKKFQSADKDDIGVILAWLDGYYRGEDHPPIINTDRFVENAKKLGAYCAAHPDQGLITATDTVFVTAQVGWIAHERRRDFAKFEGSLVTASMMFQLCFLAVEKKERMTAKSIAPSNERKPPEIFWRSFIMRPSRSA